MSIGCEPRKADKPQCEEHDDLYKWRCHGEAGHWQKHRTPDPNDPAFEVIWSTRD